MLILIQYFFESETLYTTELKQLHIPDEISKQIIQVTNYLHRNAHVWDYVRSGIYPFLGGWGTGGIKDFCPESSMYLTSNQSYMYIQS